MRQPEVEMNVYEAILARRSVRNYSSREIDRMTIHTLLEAAIYAPTALHQEPWRFVIIQDKVILRQLSERAKPLFMAALGDISRGGEGGNRLDIFNRQDFNIFYDAGLLIIIGVSSMTHLAEADCWLAAENLMLTACSLGLGTCVIGSALPALNVSEIKTELGIPHTFSAVAPIIVGYPSLEVEPTQRKAPVVLAHLPKEKIDWSFNHKNTGGYHAN